MWIKDMLGGGPLQREKGQVTEMYYGRLKIGTTCIH